MSKNRQFIQQIQKIYRSISQYPDNIKKQRNWLLKTFLVANKREEWANSGFVLPTISFVSLVLVLLTTAILFRSLERSKNASNVRVNEAVINAATPAIDRAKAKLNKLFSDARLPRATPTDAALASHFVTYNNEYTFGDEEPLKLVEAGEDDLRSVWKFPVDTNNNGKYDTYTLYGIYFKNPPVNDGLYTRSRNPLEARSIPMLGGNLSGSCGDIIGTSAILVGNSGWFKIGSKLKKSFYIYTTNVPITDTNPPTGYETYQGNQGFSALEYQQERVQLPLVNNAVVYEDDLAITPGPKFRLNGRIITNSNLLSGSGSSVPLFYQISSKDSCFYEADNGKIIVGGNLGAGGFTSSSSLKEGTRVHLFQGAGNNPKTDAKYSVKKSISVTNEPRYIAYNSLAYARRIDRLVDAQMANETNTDPQEVVQGIEGKAQQLGFSLPYNYTKTDTIRRDELELYFKKRTRRVPYEEVGSGKAGVSDDPLQATGGTDYNTTTPLNGTGDSLRPIDEWVYPFNPSDGKTKTNYSNLNLSPNSSDGNKLLPSATKPEKLENDLQNLEQYVGDRISLGNSLPELWWNGSRFVGSGEDDTQNITTYYWDDPDDNSDANNVRTRRSQIQELADLGDIERNGDWELAAAQIPSTAQDPVGGLRVITGAGIYLPNGLTTTSTSSDFTTAAGETDGSTAWSDMLPVPSATPRTVKPYPFYNESITYTVPQPTTNQPYLRMRATAVYHYESANYDQDNPKPIACVSSYYDPTSEITAKNQTGLPDDDDTNGKSHNGIVYPSPTTIDNYSKYDAVLAYQAQLQDHNGRWVNEPLKDALAKTDSDRTIADKSAIHASLCALEILDGTLAAPSDSVIPHGAIKEKAFLDARQIRQIHNDPTNNPTDYDLPVKDRQPLEIRTTVLDIDLLRKKKIGTPAVGEESTQEYLVPNSGIIYATRNDALRDTTDSSELVAPVDFRLDPTRRPNGIMLVNGSKLWREEDYRDAEKGLILVSNLPVYIYGNFNLHTKEEFTEALEDDWGNFYSRRASKLDPNFACRPNDPRLGKCVTGDEWRSAAVLSDAITLLSDNYKFGFRDEGDYDFNDYLDNIAQIDTNAYVPNKDDWYNDNGFPTDANSSSYLNNFVTPIVRRIKAKEYLVEVCANPDINQCTSYTDWNIVTTCNSSDIDTTNKTWNKSFRTDITIGTTTDTQLQTGTFKHGVLGQSLPCAQYENLPRRIAFKRNLSDGKLIKNGNNKNKLYALGIDASGIVQEFLLNSKVESSYNTTKPREIVDGGGDPVLIPWFEGQADSNDLEQVLEPILQVDRPFDTDTDRSQENELKRANHEYWLQAAVENTFNLIIASKDTPSRPTEGNGGLHNFPRFLENWDAGSSIKARISGSFIQIGRSEYANGAFIVTTDTSIVEYATDNGGGRLPFYRPPTRQWGYDVGLLSQSPDLFAFKLVVTPDDEPDEYYREVGRDDDWIEALLCAKKVDDTFAINDEEQRSNRCPDP